MTKILASIAVTLLLTACDGNSANGAEGSACVRLAQCAPGLACVNGACSSDLSGLAEAGGVPVLDAAVPFDAGVLPDAAVVDMDAGN
jgi:hypothetical protein